MEIKIMSWNMAGAKLLGKLDSPPNNVASSYIKAYGNVWEHSVKPYLSVPPNDPDYPDIILLQECIGFRDTQRKSSGRWQSGEHILQEVFRGYRCFFFPALSSFTNPHPRKWQKYREGSGIKEYLPDDIEAQQGYGICIRDDQRLRKIWVTDNSWENADVPRGDYHLCFEEINTTTGLFLGDRDTEPRLVIMGRMKVGVQGVDGRYLNFINVHLTTLKGERVGNIRLNRKGSSLRQQQLDLILENVISAYSEEDAYRIPRISSARKEDIWIVGGDFNALLDSEELISVKRMGFVDGNPDKHLMDANRGSQYDNQIGTKWSLDNPDQPLTMADYILCGLERTTFPIGGIDTTNSRRPFRPVFGDKEFETDHAVLYASFKI